MPARDGMGIAWSEEDSTSVIASPERAKQSHKKVEIAASLRSSQ
jgi:hypothetical protein